MKKVTLAALLIFLGMVTGVYGFGLLFGGSPQSSNNTTSGQGSSAQQGSKSSSGLTMQEVAKHASPSDCYLVINSNVYNVSSYIGLHPGGAAAITSSCGKEMTGIFAAIHSNFAWDLLKKYLIGNLSVDSQQTGTGSTTVAPDAFNGVASDDD